MFWISRLKLRNKRKFKHNNVLNNHFTCNLCDSQGQENVK